MDANETPMTGPAVDQQTLFYADTIISNHNAQERGVIHDLNLNCGGCCMSKCVSQRLHGDIICFILHSGLERPLCANNSKDKISRVILAKLSSAFFNQCGEFIFFCRALAKFANTLACFG